MRSYFPDLFARRTLLLCFVFLSCQGFSQGLIPEDPRWEYPHFLGFRPADARPVEVNPPRFSWPYRPGITGGANTTLKRFRFQIDDDSGFGSPLVDLTVDYNFYNSLAPLAAGTWYWRIGYDNDANGSVDEWSATKSFTVSGSEPQWDRSAIAGAEAVLAAMPRPRMGPVGGDWAAFKVWLEDTNHPRRQDWLNQLLAKANQYTAHNWFANAAYFPTTDVDESDGSRDAEVRFSTPGGEDSWGTDDFGRNAQYAAVVAFAHKITGDSAYAGAKDVLLRFAAYGHTATSLSWPEYNGGTTKQSVCITEYLALAYDWYYDDLSTSERDLLVDRTTQRVEQVFAVGKTWRSSQDAYHIGVGITGRSHPYQNFMWALPGVLLMTGEDAAMDSLDLVPLTLDFLTGVTASANYGPDDGAINEGVGYGGEKQGTMLRTALMAEMLLELDQAKNPFLSGYQEWFSQIMPNGYTRIPFGDQWGYNGITQQLHNQRALTLLTGNGKAKTRWDAVVAEEGDLLETYTFSRPWTILLAEQRLSSNAAVTPEPEAKQAVFPESGWVIAGSTPPTTAVDFDAGVRMTFRSRPRGGRSHSYRAENAFAWYAYGQTLAAGGGSRRYPDPYSRHTMSHNSILIDGRGQEWINENNPTEPYVGRLLAYEEHAGYTHWVGDATKAYRTLPGAGLKRWHRHVLFVEESYYIIFDDIEMEEGASPVTLSWLMHVDAHTNVTVGANDFSWTQGGVNARVVLSQSPGSIDIVNKILRDGYKNVVTGEDMLPAAEAAFVDHQVSGGYHDQYPDSMKSYNNLWVNTAEPVLRWQNMAALLAWETGDSAPQVTVLDSRRMDVNFGGTARTVSFNPAQPGDITVDLNVFRAHAGETISATPSISTFTEETTVLEAGGREFEFIISRFDNFDSAVTVPFSFGGTAAEGVDFYADITGSVVIPADESLARITVTLLDDSLLEGDESLTLNIGAGAYTVSAASASVTVRDDEEFSAEEITTQVEPGSTRQIALSIGNPHGTAQSYTFQYPISSTGYQWNDSLDSNDKHLIPQFEWSDISFTGTKYAGFTGQRGSTATDRISIGFAFPYYEQSHTQLGFTSVGYLGFGDDVYARAPNETFPYDDFYGRVNLAPMWSTTNRSDSDGVYYQQIDAETFIVQWNEQAAATGSKSRLSTFQAVLKKDGTIYFYYKDNNMLAPVGHQATVGIQQQLGVANRETLQLAYNTPFIPDGDNIDHAIVFWKEAQILSLASNSLTLQPGETQTVMITVDATDLNEGDYSSFLRVDSDIEGADYRVLPVSLVVTNDAAPDAPTGFTATRLSTARIDLSWTDDSPNEDSFRVERSLSDNSGFSTLVSLPAGSSSYSDTSVTDADSTRYYYRVAAVNTHGEALSSVAAAGAPLPAPSDFGVTALGTGSAELTWSFDAAASGFLVERRPAGGAFWSTIGQAPGGARAFADTLLGLERDYEYRISAFDDYFTGPVSPTVGLTLPPSIAVADGDSGEVYLSWDDAHGETGYQVSIRRSGSVPWVMLSSAVTANTTSYTVTGLLSGQTYDFSVQALDGDVPRTAALASFTTATIVEGFQQAEATPHLVVIEAEDYSSKANNGSSDDWTATTGFTGYSGTAAMQVNPDDSDNYTSNIAFTAPVLNFDINFNQTGIHYLLIRCREPGGATLNGSDSLHAGINGSLSTNAEYIEGTTAGYGIGTSWAWAYTLVGRITRVSIEVPSTGIHTVNIWPREDGVIVDKILLTTDINYLPTGSEPESVFNNGNVLTPLESWRQQHFGTATATGDTGNASSPLADGMGNLMKFALGGTPWTDASELKPEFVMVAEGGAMVPEYRFTRREGSGSGTTEGGYSIDGITYTVQVADELISGVWQTGSTQLEQVGSPVYNGDGTETVTVRLKAPVSEVEIKFMRLKLESTGASGP